MAIWLAIVLVAVGCRAEPGRDSLPLNTTSAPTLVLIPPGEPSLCPPPAFKSVPSRIRPPDSAPDALLTITQETQTTVFALDARGAAPLSESQIVGKIQLSATGRVVAYEVLEGIDSQRNTVVVADLANGAAWRVAPGDGCAVFGFTLDARGERLALLQVAMRGRFKPVASRVSVVNLALGRADALEPAQPPQIALEPIAWSYAADEIILRAFVPFQADEEGVWAMRVDGSRLRQLLQESDYVGKPRLSPDGHSLAFLAAEPGNSPRGYIMRRGEPPANALRVLNLVTGEMRTLAADPARLFEALAWDAAGERLYWRQGVWRDDGRTFRFDEIVSLWVNHSTPEAVARAPEGIVGLQPCAGGELAYITPQRSGAVVHWHGRTEWTVEKGTVEILACR